MSGLNAARLDERATLRLGGGDAVSFLDGLVTSEVGSLEEGQARAAALLTPQGKVLFDFLLLRTADGFLLDCFGGQKDDLIKRLGLYKLRADVTVADASDDFDIVAVWGGDLPAQAGNHAYPDPRHADLGWRIFAPAGTAGDLVAQIGAEEASAETYRRHRISVGIVEGGTDYEAGELFPHEACMDQLAGVSFTKGCFVGQEVVSRMQHRGTARNRVLPFTSSGAAPEKGTEIRSGEKAAGTVLAAGENAGLGLVRLDRLDSGFQAQAGGATLTFSRPDWARFDMPSAGS